MTEPLHIVQIAPEIGPGSGVGMVAYALEREFLAAGARVERFTLADARGKPTPASRSRLRLGWDVVWFSTVGTLRARKYLAQRPDAMSICHNDVLVGDVYVNHGTLPAAMRARGHYMARMVRNPLHLFTLLRDRTRYRGHIHRAVVALSSTEVTLMRREYGHVRPPITVIGNGVDLDRFPPANDEQRASARERLGIGDRARVALFVGHEFDRKGLPAVMDALRRVHSDLLLLVVGGSEDMIAHARAQAVRLGVDARVRFVGEQADITSSLAASDLFVMPSHYESSGLVYLEALSSGLPVISTPVGVAADVVQDGVNGFLLPLDPAILATRMEVAAESAALWRQSARSSALPYAWSNIARQYLDLLKLVRSEQDSKA